MGHKMQKLCGRSGNSMKSLISCSTEQLFGRTKWSRVSEFLIKIFPLQMDSKQMICHYDESICLCHWLFCELLQRAVWYLLSPKLKTPFCPQISSSTLRTSRRKFWYSGQPLSTQTRAECTLKKKSCCYCETWLCHKCTMDVITVHNMHKKLTSVCV